MTLRIQHALGAIALAGAALVMAPLASANQTYRGTFHLPVQTYWGGSVLAPGDYTVSIESATERTGVLHVEGPNGVATILTGPVEAREVSSNGRLILANVNGVYAIRELDAGSAGKAYTFALPKGLNAAAANGTTTIAVH